MCGMVEFYIHFYYYYPLILQASKVAENVELLWTAYHRLPSLCVPVFVCVFVAVFV